MTHILPLIRVYGIIYNNSPHVSKLHVHYFVSNLYHVAVYDRLTGIIDDEIYTL